MTDGWLICIGGLLGSGHCVGMCGTFALALGGSRPNLAANLVRQLVYGMGRVFTYTIAGAAAGYAGWRLALTNGQAVLALAAGALLIYQGLVAAGVMPARLRPTGRGPCPGAGLFAALLGATRLHSAFLGGVVNGLLPCGLVYAYLALAASAGTLAGGAATMTLFGLGTLPVLALVGCGGAVLSRSARCRLLRAAAWCVVLTGVLTVARGAAAFTQPAPGAPDSCPLCAGLEVSR